MNLILRTITLTTLTIGSLCFAEEGFVSLFDGHTLEGWNAARNTGQDDWGAFSINKEEKAIHVYAGKKAGSTQNKDCLNTDTQFSHYILKLEYKWLDKRFAPRTDMDRDAGLLFHVHGNLKEVWPLSIEMQIGETPGDKEEKPRFHTGDLFVLGKNLRVKTAQTNGYYDPDAEVVRGRSIRTRLGAEKRKGEWNEMELRVYGAEKATFVLNGEIVLELFDIERETSDGEFVPLNKGHIGLQAEFAEILYRNIRIKELPNH